MHDLNILGGSFCSYDSPLCCVIGKIARTTLHQGVCFHDLLLSIKNRGLILQGIISSLFP